MPGNVIWAAILHYLRQKRRADLAKVVQSNQKSDGFALYCRKLP